MKMREPYRVAVWGSGSVGKCAIRECSLLPELQLVSVLTYSESKHGVDAGVLAGLEPLGVKASTRVEDVLAAKPEVVIHCSRDFGDFAADDDILMLLQSGINVITSLPYFYPASRGEEVAQRFVEAGKKGNATLYGTGTNPSVMFQRVAPAMLGFTNDVQHISLQEVTHVADLGPEAVGLLSALGLGRDPEEVTPNGGAGMVAENNFRQDAEYLAVALGKKVDRVVRQDFNVIAPHDLEVPGVITIKKGKVGRVSVRMEAWCDGKPFCSSQVYWYVSKAMDPKIVENGPGLYFVIEVEGRPSTRAVIEMEHTFKPDPDPFSHDGFVSTAVAMIQAVPRVIEAEPGIMLSAMPEIRWKPDLRQ